MVIYTDAACDQEDKTGGVGAALFNKQGACVGWFGIPLAMEQCALFGGWKSRQYSMSWSCWQASWRLTFGRLLQALACKFVLEIMMVQGFL